MKKITSLLFILLIACNNSEEELEVQEQKVEIVENWYSALEDDVIYKQLVDDRNRWNGVTTDINRWISVFVQDAKRVANIDLSYVLDGEIILRPSGEIPSAYAGWAWGMCNESKVSIGLQEYVLKGYMPRGSAYPEERNRNSFSSTIHTIYHELGHDILNLSHTCNQNDLMFNDSSENYPCSGELIEIPRDHPTHPRYNYQGFKIARDRMFAGIEQYYADCD